MKMYVGFLALALAGVLGMFSAEQLKDNFLNSRGPQVTKITNYVGNSGGTGFYVRAPSGKVFTLTNAHVCGLADKDGLVFARQDDEINVLKVQAIYPDHDLCLLDAPATARGLMVARKVSNGENIYILGHPLLEPKSLVKGQMAGELVIT